MGNAHSPFIEQNNGVHLPVVKSILWHGYAQVAGRYHAMPLSGKGLVSGFHPVFLFKNMVAQRDKFSHRVSLNTCNQGAKSSIYLIGFMRGTGPDAQVISITSADGSFITKAVSNAHADHDVD